MRAVVQRSLAAKVTIAGQTVGAIDHGFVVLLGVGPEDTSADSDYLAEKISKLRQNELGASRCRRASPINIAIHTVCRYTSR